MPPITTNVDQRALLNTKFPPEFNRKVNTDKINVPVCFSWAATELTKILGFDDEIVRELVSELLSKSKFPDIKSIQIQLKGFLGNDTESFCKDLWNLCLSAQDNPQGVPQQLLDAKKLEIQQERENAAKAREAASRQHELLDARGRAANEARLKESEARRQARDVEPSSRHSTRGRDFRAQGPPRYDDRQSTRRRDSRSPREHIRRDRDRDGYRDHRREDRPRDRDRTRRVSPDRDSGRYKDETRISLDRRQREPQDRHRSYSPDRRSRRDDRYRSPSRDRRDEKRRKRDRSISSDRTSSRRATSRRRQKRRDRSYERPVRRRSHSPARSPSRSPSPSPSRSSSRSRHGSSRHERSLNRVRRRSRSRSLS